MGEPTPAEKTVARNLADLGWGGRGNNTALAVFKLVDQTRQRTRVEEPCDALLFRLRDALDGKCKVRPSESETLRTLGEKLVLDFLNNPYSDPEEKEVLGRLLE